MGGVSILERIRLRIHGLRVLLAFNELEIEKKKLIKNQEHVLLMIGVTSKTEKVNDAVPEWLNEVEKLIEGKEMLEIKRETDQLNACSAACFHIRSGSGSDSGSGSGSGNDFKHRYNEMLEKIKTLNNRCEFESLGSLIPSLEYFSSGDFVCFESTKRTSDQLMEALQDDSIRIVGLHGKKGSGKTKLAEAVGGKAKNLRIFNEVVFVTVSLDPNNVRPIQDQIADTLNFRFDTNSEFARAKEICSKIINKNRVLVILDNVRAKLELKDIRIPVHGNYCKILLITRRLQECTLMDCQREIPLHPLFEDEAWTLLKEHSGIDDESSSSSSSELLTVAREVANECKGVPSKIKDVGSSLKGQPVEEWKAILSSLRHSTARYQIFLSFRGEDTRYSFTGSLYDALRREGFKTFMDDGDGGLEGGDQISEALKNAIEASRLCIVVLSENFAFSSWCLGELATILECMKKKNQLVWPIFYKVDPSDVRYQKNSYGSAMAVHEHRYPYDYEKRQRWRSTLSAIAGMSGMHYSSGYEYVFIQTIVERAKNNKNRLYLNSNDME